MNSFLRNDTSDQWFSYEEKLIKAVCGTAGLSREFEN